MDHDMMSQGHGGSGMNCPMMADSNHMRGDMRAMMPGGQKPGGTPSATPSAAPEDHAAHHPNQ